ncbi:PREDICTED: alcohol dehydrogenase [NADP(+)]-like [Rhagoletis zephyria]|uniref:alcohol dehydrogenase [NADP(+)]-like n=1 Tax=Rhagoletis zephyria TaxID=28612 RepID=UPI0008118D3F|nr:PREDICTED: alcohol dehydrogenase [NADP(+)]-like [Rhagoletis zephyria]
MYAPCVKTCLRENRLRSPLARTVQFNNGVKMPIIGLNTNGLEAHIATRVTKDAIESGYRHIDCSPTFCNQEEVGKGIKEKIDEGFIKREQLYISSKLWNTRHHPKFVRPALEETLKQLKLDFLDNYVIQTPMGFKDGFVDYPRNTRGEIMYSDVDYVDTWAAMEALVDKGLVRSIGLANFNAEQIERILEVARIPPANLQVECHPYLTQNKLMDLCCKHKIVFMAYGPTGPRTGVDNIVPLLKHPLILCLANKYEKTPTEILIRYQVQRGNAVLIRTTCLNHMDNNLTVESFQLSRDDLEKLHLMNCNIRRETLSNGTGHPHHPFENDCL